MAEVITSKETTKGSVKYISQTTSKHDRNAILDYIREHQPITQYRLGQALGINYTSIYQICKEFHFAGLIEFKLEIGDNNRTHKLITIPLLNINLQGELNPGTSVPGDASNSQ